MRILPPDTPRLLRKLWSGEGKESAFWLWYGRCAIVGTLAAFVLWLYAMIFYPHVMGF